MRNYDAIVIGAGPAGSASALFLHQRGLRVLVLDRAEFPRDKVCGEFVSPASDNIFRELGVLGDIEKRSPVRLRGVAVSSYGKPELKIDYPPCPITGQAMTSLSLPRFSLDHLMMNKLMAEGVDVRQRHSVDDFIFDGNAVAGVKGRDSSNTPFSFSARVVVDASGRNGLSLRRLGLIQKKKGPGRVALAAHWEQRDFPNDYCYMHISEPGYTGMAPVGSDSVNVVLVVPARYLKGRNLESYFKSAVLENPRRRFLLDKARLKEKVRTVGSLAYEVCPVPCGGLVLAGDTTGFIDPFTGEGIYLSLRSAQLGANRIEQAFRAGDFSRRFFAEYEKQRREEFGRKFILSRALQKILYRKGWCDRVVLGLQMNPDMAQTLVGVIGDYYPASRVVSRKFLWKAARAVLFPTSGTPPRSINVTVPGE